MLSAYNELKYEQVAVFDVNHNYGTFLVDSYRLFDAVNTFDLLANSYRGLILTEILEDSEVSMS